jgi:probable rRNA maturation factor
MTGMTARRGARKTMPRVSDPTRAVAIDLAIPCAKWRRALSNAETIATEAARAALKHSGKKFGAAELSLILSNDKTVQKLNAQWRGKDAPTNVLAFASEDVSTGPAPTLLGDVVLAYETVAREAKEQGKALSDHFRHLVIHGVLHLLGYDHQADRPAKRMEALETRILALLGVADPYRVREGADD